MTLLECIRAVLREGRKARRPGWSVGTYLVKGPERSPAPAAWRLEIDGQTTATLFMHHTTYAADVVAGDWELTAGA